MILSNENLKFHLSNWLSQNKKIVFTNGCFDLIHQGHKDLLNKAKSLGDILIVGLCEIGSVDNVIMFDEDTPDRLIREIKPHVLVKGGDYTIDSIVGSRDVLAAGGIVEIIPLTPGYSTSKTIEKMNR